MCLRLPLVQVLLTRICGGTANAYQGEQWYRLHVKVKLSNISINTESPPAGSYHTPFVGCPALVFGVYSDKAEYLKGYGMSLPVLLF